MQKVLATPRICLKSHNFVFWWFLPLQVENTHISGHFRTLVNKTKSVKNLILQAQEFLASARWTR